MALKKNGPLATDAAGASEVLTLSVVQAVADDGGGNDGSGNGASSNPAGATTQIATAFYGTDAAGNPHPAAVSANGQSVTLTTLQGVHALTLHFVAASDGAATVQLSQDGSVLLETTLDGHTGDGTLLIEGT